MKIKIVFPIVIAAMAGVACPEDFGFGMLEPPEVDSVEPDSGPTRGGEQVTVTGEHFIDGTTILFGDKECRDVEIKSETEIHCVTPVHDAGEVEVKGAHPDRDSGNRTATYTYDAPPVFTLHPGDEVGYNKLNINHCLDSTCVDENEEEAAWRSTWIIEDDGVYLSEVSGEWEVRAHYYHQVIEGAGDSAPLASTWLSDFGPYDKPTDFTEDGIGTFTTSMPPVPLAVSESVSFPFFDMANWEYAEDKFRQYVRGIDPDANVDSQRAARRLEAYYIDQGTPPLEHHVWVIFHSVGIVCSFDEEIIVAPADPAYNQSDFQYELITPKSNVSFAYVTRVGGSKQYCNCASDSGCE